MKNLRNSPKKKKIREVFYTLFYNDKERKTSIVLFACMFVCLPVRLYPINVKTPRKVYGDRIFKICLINIHFLKILKIHEIREIFRLFLFSAEKYQTGIIKMQSFCLVHLFCVIFLLIFFADFLFR